MPAFRNPPEKLFTKVIVSKGDGIHTPQDGSICRIKVLLDSVNLLSGLDEDECKEIMVNDVDGPVDQIINDCVRTMKEKEVCYVEFLHQTDAVTNRRTLTWSQEEKNMNKDIAIANDIEGSKYVDFDTYDRINTSGNLDKCTATELSSFRETEFCISETFSNNAVLNGKTNFDSFDKNQSNLVKLQFQLMTFTPKPKIFEMSITEKWLRACYHKQKGLDLYSVCKYQFAFKQFGLALKYVISLEHNVPSNKGEGIDTVGLKHSCYLNLSACQLKHQNFECVVINCSKALNIQTNNAKALYRRGVAYVQLQEYEKAEEDLIAAQLLEPENKAIVKQMQLLKSRVKNLNQYYASAMKKMFS